MSKLTALKVKGKLGKGKYADGDGLYLKVRDTGSKAWVFRYAGEWLTSNTGKRYRKQVEMGLGSYPALSLADARACAAGHSEVIAQGKDPRVMRDAKQQKQAVNQIWTFDRCAKAFIDSKEAGWKNEKSEKQWRATLNKYASPVFGGLPVEEVTLALVLDALEPIWETKTETASRVRGRIERILSWAIVKGYRPAPNPAIWRGTLDQILDQPTKVTKPLHHNALPYLELPLFMSSLRRREALAAKALQFTILTGCRTSEVLGADWSEVNLLAKVWTVPASRMKSDRDHRVPLAQAALDLLEHLPRVNEWLFPSVQYGKHLSGMAMLNLLKRMNRADITVHGFRSTFRDWVAETTSYPDRLAESALAHVLGDKTEAAYQRGDLLKKRAQLMQDWAEYACASVSSKVVAL